MKNMKDQMQTTFLFLLIALLLAGCEGNAKPSDDPISSKSAITSLGEVTVASRETGSGTRKAFVQAFGIEKPDQAGKIVDQTVDNCEVCGSTEVMMTSVQSNRSSIGFVSAGSLCDRVTPLKVDGVPPSTENVQNGSYPFVRTLYLITADEPPETAQDFIDFILSVQGQGIAADCGYVDIGKGEPYISQGQTGVIRVAGSSSAAVLMKALIAAYENENPKMTIEFEVSDSQVGIDYAADRLCDIGLCSRELTEEELAIVTARPFARDGIAVIVNRGNHLEDIGKDMVMDIFTGEITEWEELVEEE